MTEKRQLKDSGMKIVKFPLPLQQIFPSGISVGRKNSIGRILIEILKRILIEILKEY